MIEEQKIDVVLHLNWLTPQRADFDCMRSDPIDKNGVALHARDLMPPDQKSRSRRYYTFPEIEGEREAISSRAGEMYAICLSFCELYQDRIYDLLDDHQSFIQKRKNLPLKRDVASGRRFVSGLRKIYADTIEVPTSPIVP